MSVPPIQLAGLNLIASAAGTLAHPMDVGDVVSGRVLDELEQGTRLILEINGLKVEAHPPANRTWPQQFQARVLSGGPRPVLELLERSAPSSPAVAALRARLPSQGGLQPLLADLHALATARDARTLPESVRAALARLDAAISDHRDVLDPDTLRDTVARAGLQFEHALLEYARAASWPPPAQLEYDLKGALERLARVLEELPPTPSSRPTPPGPETPPPLLDLPLQPQARGPAPATAAAPAVVHGMLQHVQAALSRIEIMQLEAHPSVFPQACMVEIPLRSDDGFDVLQLRIERDGGRADAKSDPPRWTLGFTLDPPSLGAVEGRIRLYGTKVDVALWAERADAVQALEEQTQVLARLLQGSGLELAQLRVRHGTPLRFTGLAHRLLEASA